jgi:hypothetical protein
LVKFRTESQLPFWEMAAPLAIFFVGLRIVSGRGTKEERKIRLSKDICFFNLQTMQQQLGECERDYAS